jgi:hypothetical protein
MKNPLTAAGFAVSGNYKRQEKYNSINSVEILTE